MKKPVLLILTLFSSSFLFSMEKLPKSIGAQPVDQPLFFTEQDIRELQETERQIPEEIAEFPADQPFFFPTVQEIDEPVAPVTPKVSQPEELTLGAVATWVQQITQQKEPQLIQKIEGNQVTGDTILRWITDIRRKQGLSPEYIGGVELSGYVFIGGAGKKSLTKGIRKNVRIKDYANETDPALKKEIGKQLAGNYKIHLMPKNSNDLKQILNKIIQELKGNPKFSKALQQLKIKSDIQYDIIDPSAFIDTLKKGHSESIVPLIVLYPATGKSNAQYVLNTIYKLFGSMSGLNITPRYNEQVTSLIYFAQGDADDKTGNWEKYYQAPSNIYHSSLIPGNHRLTNPAR